MKIIAIAKRIYQWIYSHQLISLCGVVSIFFLICTLNTLLNFNQHSSSLAGQIYELKQLKLNGPNWQRKANQLDGRLPVFLDSKEAEESVTQLILESSRLHGLTLDYHQKQPRSAVEIYRAEQAAAFESSAIEVRVDGREEQVVRWLHSLQSPENFTGVDFIALEKAGMNITCEATVVQWYKSAPKPEKAPF